MLLWSWGLWWLRHQPFEGSCIADRLQGWGQTRSDSETLMDKQHMRQETLPGKVKQWYPLEPGLGGRRGSHRCLVVKPTRPGEVWKRDRMPQAHGHQLRWGPLRLGAMKARRQAGGGDWGPCLYWSWTQLLNPQRIFLINVAPFKGK